MSNVDIKLDSSGINELLHSAEIGSALREVGNGVQSRAGDNFQAVTLNLPTRLVVRVSAANKDGVKENLDNNVLLKAVHR